jgi:hypothetical protein
MVKMTGRAHWQHGMGGRHSGCQVCSMHLPQIDPPLPWPYEPQAFLSRKIGSPSASSCWQRSQRMRYV